MQERNNSKYLTFVEVVIIVLVCLFLLAIVPPAFQQSRSYDFRITCARNLSTIGTAMIIYSNDYEDKLPCVGGRDSMWTRSIPNWMANNRYNAYGLASDGSGGMATITSSFYLLVKYTELWPKTFVCPGDSGTTTFNLEEYGASDREYIDLWDFGPEPTKHCSYAYHMPYGLYALNISNEPGMAVAADRNPWISSPSAKAKDASLYSSFNPDGGRDAIKIGNSITHNEEGQNVLFLDRHVGFEKSPCCGINDDNIYTWWDGTDIRRGGIPIPFTTEPMDKLDSFLVSEPVINRTISTVTKEIRAVDSANLKKTSVVATLDCPIPEHKNVIWCSTFQMTWDKLKNDIIGEPVKVPGAEELVERLNKAEVSEKDLEKESFYATAGFIGEGIIEQIQNEMKNHFPSESAPDFNELDSSPSTMSPKTIVSYSYLNVNVGFKYPFFFRKNGLKFEDSNGERSDVKAFCGRTSSSNAHSIPVREQVEILYYKHGQNRKTNEFAVDLSKDTNPYQVVLACVPQGKNLREQITAVEEKISEFKHDPDYKLLCKLRTIDSLIVPDILYKLTHKYEELLGKKIKNRKFLGYWFLIARQMIDFSLSRTGVTIKSHAQIVVPPFRRGGRRVKEPRYFHFNRSFLIYVKKRQGGTDPFFVMWVDNAELMQEFGSK